MTSILLNAETPFGRGTLVFAADIISPMAALVPFRALRPVPAAAERVAAVPYDVVNTAEARELALGNPLSFLHVSRAEIDLPSGTDPHTDAV
ncbi:MAG TPA: DUF1015 family protein, partial [Vicinamibacterales bacterium]|nr:DUF1015 family protein [Vicinamibacterales bacterium]